MFKRVAFSPKIFNKYVNYIKMFNRVAFSPKMFNKYVNYTKKV